MITASWQQEITLRWIADENDALMVKIFWYDYLTGLLLIISILIWANVYVKKRQDNILIKKYFKKGLYLKVFGACAFAIYHAFIYRGGDTFGYFYTAKTVSSLFYTQTDWYFRMVFFPLEENKGIISQMHWLWPDDVMWRSEANYFPIRICAVLQLVFLQNYITNCIIFSMMSFWGIWKCFIFFNKMYPDLDRGLAIAFLFFPTVVFWGSGLGKDSLTLGAICGLTVCAYQVFVYRQKLFVNSIGIVILTFSLFKLKAYVPLAFLFPLVFALSFSFLGRMKSVIVKIFLFPLVVGLIVGAAYFMNGFIEKNFQQYAIGNLTEKIVLSNKSMDKAGSSFDLGINPLNVRTLGDMVPFFPQAIVATWYRPWLWESRNPAMLLSGLEGLAMLLFSLNIMRKGYVFGTFKQLFSSAILFSLFIYCLIFSTLVGLSTTNFGTLVRYKLPCMPFLLVVFFVIDKRLSEGRLKSAKVNIKIKTPSKALAGSPA